MPKTEEGKHLICYAGQLYIVDFYICIENHYDTSNPSTVYYCGKSVDDKLVFSTNLKDAKKYDSLKEAQLVAERFGGRVAQEFNAVEDADAKN
jgi:hypothetical protein